jgi:hypothetical protein
MSNWIFKPATPAPRRDVEPGTFTDTVEGLAVEVEVEVEGYIRWSAEGFLGDLPVSASGFDFKVTPVTVAAAQAQAVKAAHRLYAAGVRGEKSEPAEESQP